MIDVQSLNLALRMLSFGGVEKFNPSEKESKEYIEIKGIHNMLKNHSWYTPIWNHCYWTSRKMKHREHRNIKSMKHVTMRIEGIDSLNIMSHNNYITEMVHKTWPNIAWKSLMKYKGLRRVVKDGSKVWKGYLVDIK